MTRQELLRDMTRQELLREMTLLDIQKGLLREANDPCLRDYIDSIPSRIQELGQLYWEGVEKMTGSQVIDLIKGMEKRIRELRRFSVVRR